MHNFPEVDFSAFKETAWLYVIVVSVVELNSLRSRGSASSATSNCFATALAPEGVHRADAIRSSSPRLPPPLVHNASTDLAVLSSNSVLSSVFLRGGLGFYAWRMACGAGRNDGWYSVRSISLRPVAPKAFFLCLRPRLSMRSGSLARSGFAFSCSSGWN
jgi:hypothetical protein